MDQLTPIETDFIDFLAREQNRPLAEVETAYRRTREEFDFASPDYAQLMARIQYLHRLEHDNFDDASSIASYRHWGLLSVFRQLSYSLPQARPGWRQLLIKELKKGQYGLIARAALNRLLGRRTNPGTNEPSTAQRLAGLIQPGAVILDYGCGLAYTSFELGRLVEDCRFVLADVDCLGLRFTADRFAKHGLTVETVIVSEAEPYPALPEHDLCIATDVMEHLWQPLEAYAQIARSLRAGGVLFGQFHDFKPGFWHVSADLAPLRARLEAEFEPLGGDCFRRR